MPGLALELALIEHFESWRQWLPLAVLGAGLAASLAVLIRPGPAAIRVFRVVMVAFVATGLLGLYFHYAGNAAFELEMNASLGGLALFREAVMGATPAMAPAALSYMGLLGLVAAWRHPAAEARAGPFP